MNCMVLFLMKSRFCILIVLTFNTLKKKQSVEVDNLLNINKIRQRGVFY